MLIILSFTDNFLCWAFLANFKFQLLYFSGLEFPFDSFLLFLKIFSVVIFY